MNFKKKKSEVLKYNLSIIKLGLVINYSTDFKFTKLS